MKTKKRQKIPCPTRILTTGRYAYKHNRLFPEGGTVFYFERNGTSTVSYFMVSSDEEVIVGVGQIPLEKYRSLARGDISLHCLIPKALRGTVASQIKGVRLWGVSETLKYHKKKCKYSKLRVLSHEMCDVEQDLYSLFEYKNERNHPKILLRTHKVKDPLTLKESPQTEVLFFSQCVDKVLLGTYHIPKVHSYG